ncbi:hypothetical protein DPMN_036909, partial [Dreissena polymorpha]
MLQLIIEIQDTCVIPTATWSLGVSGHLRSPGWAHSRSHGVSGRLRSHVVSSNLWSPGWSPGLNGHLFGHLWSPGNMWSPGPSPGVSGHLWSTCVNGHLRSPGSPRWSSHIISHL